MTPAAALLLLLAPLQAAPAQDHAAHVDSFLAALPPSTKQRQTGETPLDASDLKRLIAANPAKEAVIRQTIAARIACNDKLSGSFAMDALRKSAEMLTDAELDKLTEFYAGPDYPKLEAAGDKADVAPFLARYPLQRFMEVTQKVMADAPGEMFDGMMACEETAQKSLAAAGVKD